MSNHHHSHSSRRRDKRHPIPQPLSSPTMNPDDLHEIVFNWPYTDPNSVIVTGSFDGWSKSHNLTKGPEGFSGSLHIPWQHSISYKYLVDGRWALDDSKPKRVEPGGYVNNFYIAPCKPLTSAEQVQGNHRINGVEKQVVSRASEFCSPSDDETGLVPAIAGATTGQDTTEMAEQKPVSQGLDETEVEDMSEEGTPVTHELNSQTTHIEEPMIAVIPVDRLASQHGVTDPAYDEIKPTPITGDSEDLSEEKTTGTTQSADTPEVPPIVADKEAGHTNGSPEGYTTAAEPVVITETPSAEQASIPAVIPVSEEVDTAGSELLDEAQPASADSEVVEAAADKEHVKEENTTSDYAAPEQNGAIEHGDHSEKVATEPAAPIEATQVSEAKDTTIAAVTKLENGDHTAPSAAATTTTEETKSSPSVRLSFVPVNVPPEDVSPTSDLNAEDAKDANKSAAQEASTHRLLGPVKRSSVASTDTGEQTKESLGSAEPSAAGAVSVEVPADTSEHDAATATVESEPVVSQQEKEGDAMHKEGAEPNKEAMRESPQVVPIETSAPQQPAEKAKEIEAVTTTKPEVIPPDETVLSPSQEEQTAPETVAEVPTKVVNSTGEEAGQASVTDEQELGHGQPAGARKPLELLDTSVAPPAAQSAEPTKTKTTPGGTEATNGSAKAETAVIATSAESKPGPSAVTEAATEKNGNTNGSAAPAVSGSTTSSVRRKQPPVDTTVSPSTPTTPVSAEPASPRKRKTTFIGKIKRIFSHDKEKDKVLK